MPTILQLPSVAAVTAADEIPLSQSGVTHSVSVGSLLAGTQPAIISDPGTLLGRSSLGAGGPEAVVIGSGLVLNDGTLTSGTFDLDSLQQQPTLSVDDHVMINSGGTLMLLPLASLRGLFVPGANISIDASGTISAGSSSGGSVTSYSITGLAPVTTIAGSDLVAVSQGGMDHTISYANLLDGLTIDLAQPAVAAMDTDTLWVAQGSSTMLRQSFAAIWSWLMAKQPSYRLPVIEINANTTLDGISHNGRVLICSQPITLTPAPVNMGNGFYCDVLNLSNGSVTLGTGIITSSGTTTLSAGQAAMLRVVTYSGGTVVYASCGASTGSGGSGTQVTAPGQVSGLATSNLTASSVTLNWSAPASGGAVSSYTVQYRISGNSTWSIFANGITDTSATVTGLTASTAYDFQVYAVNSGGSGPPSTQASATTSALTGTVTAITWNIWPVGPYTHGMGSIGLNAHITPSTASVQFGFSNSASVPPSSWIAGTYVNTDLWGAYVSTPATAGTWYAWVEGTDGSRPTVYPTPFTVT